MRIRRHITTLPPYSKKIVSYEVAELERQRDFYRDALTRQAQTTLRLHSALRPFAENGALEDRYRLSEDDFNTAKAVYEGE